VPSVAGREYPPVEFEVKAEHAAEFARSIDADPAAGIPPTYAAVYALFTTAPQLFADPEAEVDFGRLVHAGQEFEWARHPEPGETLAARGKVVSDIDRKGARFITLETTCTAATGAAVCTGRSLFVVRPPG
jgi:acyl dehydratase